MLLKVLNRLIEGGSSVLLVEHNLEIIHQSDYVIDLGPEAGEKGGEIIGQGTPEELMKNNQESHRTVFAFLRGSNDGDQRSSP